MLGRDKAAEIIREHGSNDLYEIIRSEGLSIARWTLAERVSASSP